MENKTISFSTDVWKKLLKPLPTYDTRSKYESCFRYWCGMDEDKRNRVYHIIEERKQKGLFVNPNPRFALDDAAQEDEVLQAKAQVAKRKEPTNYNGSSKYLKEVKKTPLVSAPYEGVFGIYSLAEAIEFHLEIKRAINFNLREYMEQKAINPDYEPLIINRD